MSNKIVNWKNIGFVDGWKTFKKLQENNNLTIDDCLKYKEILIDLQSLSLTPLPLISDRLSEIEAAKIFIQSQDHSKTQFVVEMEQDDLVTDMTKININSNQVTKMDPFSIEMLNKYDPRSLKIYRKEDGSYWIGDQKYEKPSDLPLEFDENPSNHKGCSWTKYTNLNRAEVYRKTRCFCLPDDNLNSSKCRKTTHWVPYFHEGKCVLDKVIFV